MPPAPHPAQHARSRSATAGRRAILVWRRIKPFLPLLFFAVLLLPTLLALWHGTLSLPWWPSV
jgi:hypothetical protein